MANGSEGEYARAGANAGLAGNADMREQANTFAQNNLRADMAERTNLDARPKLRSRLDASAGMNGGGRGGRTDQRGWRHFRHSATSIAEISASQASAPSTLAWPRYHHILRRLANRSRWNSTRSPGTTGFRNFALSIVIK
jgi:hypothetical protein